MTFEIGNQASKGLTNNGRPAKYNIEDLAIRLDEWSKHPSAIQLLDFCSENNFSAKYLSRWAKESSDFCEALELAKTRIGAKRERLMNYQKLDARVFNRYQGMYDLALNEYERGEKEFEYELRKNLESKGDVSIRYDVVNYSQAIDG